MKWQRIYAGRWKFDELIHVKEARGPLWALRRLCKQKVNHNLRFLMLNDKLGIVLALEKGRASDPRVLGICRRWAALCMSCGIRVRVRWIPSEINVSDFDSRRWSNF